MLGIILCTHSEFAIGLKKAAEMITGEHENFDAFSFMNGDSVDDLKESLIECGNKYKEMSIPYCYIVDLYGATPFNLALAASLDSNAPVITGANLPLLLELLLTQDNYTIENCRENLENSMKSVKESMQVIDTIALFNELQ